MGDIAILPAWRRDSPTIAEDAQALWAELAALPAGDSADARVRELCSAAYQGRELIGVSTIAMRVHPLLPGCRLGFFRCLVRPEHRRRDVARKLLRFSADLVERWSAGNPQEKLLGLGIILETALLTERSRDPVWWLEIGETVEEPVRARAPLFLAGRTAKGQQIRVMWFEHARLDGPQSADAFQ